MDFFRKIERELDLPRAEKEKVIREIHAHYDEIKDELTSKGASVEDAENEAARQLGSAESIAAGLGAVHLRSGLKSTLLAVLPFLGILPVLMQDLGVRSVFDDRSEITHFYLNRPLLLTGLTLLTCFGIAMLAAGIRELLRDRRPAWLATVLALALVWPLGVGQASIHALTADHYQRWIYQDSRYAGLILLISLVWFFVALAAMLACAWVKARKRSRLIAFSLIAGLGLIPLAISTTPYWFYITLPPALMSPLLLEIRDRARFLHSFSASRRDA